MATSSMAIPHSGLMVERAEKSTRFPIILSLTRPFLPLSLPMMDLVGAPERVWEGFSPRISLLMSVAA